MISQWAICNDYDISETFNKFFENMLPNLKIIPLRTFRNFYWMWNGNPLQNATNKFLLYLR